MNSNCAVRNLYSDSLLQKVEINLWGGVWFLAISLSENKSENNCIQSLIFWSLRIAMIKRLRNKSTQ